MAFLLTALPRIFGSPLLRSVIGAVATPIWNVVKETVKSTLGGLAIEAVKTIGGTLASKAIEAIKPYTLESQGKSMAQQLGIKRNPAGQDRPFEEVDEFADMRGDMLDRLNRRGRGRKRLRTDQNI